jgi:hypothetical protein
LLVGHIGVGLLGKSLEPKLSLGTLVFATVLADLLWCVLLFAGVESAQLRPGKGAVNYLASVEFPFSHSLLMTLVWGVIFGALYFWKRRYVRGAVVVFGAVLSHWVLDFIAHKPDLLLAPTTQKYFGLGLWNSVGGTILVEGGLWILAIILYTRATTAKKLLGIIVFWPVVALLTLAWFNNIAGPPPPSVTAMGISSLIFFSLIVAWAYWINRLRPAKAQV